MEEGKLIFLVYCFGVVMRRELFRYWKMLRFCILRKIFCRLLKYVQSDSRLHRVNQGTFFRLNSIYTSISVTSQCSECHDTMQPRAECCIGQLRRRNVEQPYITHIYFQMYKYACLILHRLFLHTNEKNKLLMKLIIKIKCRIKREQQSNRIFQIILESFFKDNSTHDIQKTENDNE